MGGFTQTTTTNMMEPKLQVDEEQALDPYLIAEALRVFDLADKDHNGQLDMAELSNVHNSKEYAKTMMSKWDTDLSGTISKDEWLIYFAKSFERNENAASTVLKLYEKQIGENKENSIVIPADPIAEPNAEPDPAEPTAEPDAAEPAAVTNPTEVIIEDTTAPNQCR